MPKKILIVDDEKDALDFLNIELTNAGYEVEMAQTAAESIAQAVTVNPDLILMDVMLPDMNGAEAVKEIKNNARTQDIPILFVTAMLTKREEKSQKLGFNVDGKWYDAIAKPFDHEDLLNQVNVALEGSNNG